jgi:hypothetical protein
MKILANVGFHQYDKERFNRDDISRIKMANVLRWSIMHKCTNTGIIARIIETPKDENGKFKMSYVYNFIAKMIRKKLIKSVIMPQTIQRKVYIATQTGWDFAQDMYQNIDLSYHNTDASKINGNKINHDLVAQEVALNLIDAASEKSKNVDYWSEREFSIFCEKLNSKKRADYLAEWERWKKEEKNWAVPSVKFKRKPDFVIEIDDKKTAYEIEVTAKSKHLYKNIILNYAEGIRQQFVDKVVYYCSNRQIKKILDENVEQHSVVHHKGKTFLTEKNVFKQNYSTNFSVNLSPKLLRILMGSSVAERLLDV